MAGKLFHVIADGFHPHNTWERRPDGLYDLAGSAYAFRDDEVKRCTRATRSGTCACWQTGRGRGHSCPREGCTGTGEEVCGCVPGVGLGCEAPVCVIDAEPRFISPYGAATLGFSLD